MDDWANFMKGLQDKAVEAGSTREEQIRRMASAAGMLGPGLEEAVQKAMELEKAISEGEKKKQNQEATVKTLQDLRDQLRKSRIGEKAFAREQFLKGVTDEKQIQEFDQLQQELTKNDATAVFESMDTALGAFKVAQDPTLLAESLVSDSLLGADAAQPTQDDVPDLVSESNDLLAEIVRHTAAFAGVMS
jgi:HPt (histidine-containing phosphotransfer) domain-containing protein